MSSTAVATATELPVGTWTLDPIHSSASFAIKHMGVATFRGRFEDFDATLEVSEGGAAELRGTVRADSIVVKDENLKAHLGSPEFFDTERYPELRFVARSLRRDGDELVADGERTIKDQTGPVHARGTITDPAETLGGAVKLGIELEAVIDRTQFGLNFNAVLPKGGAVLANDVRLIVELELAQVEA
jgi:polyisoprenoid-binding protein YceI